MKGMIDRGFTTVRDTGGADWGIKTAVEAGLIPGPRLFISGRAIGPTGGHSDSRRRTDYRPRLRLLQRHGLQPWPSPTAPTRCARRCASRCARAPTR